LLVTCRTYRFIDKNDTIARNAFLKLLRPFFITLSDPNTSAADCYTSIKYLMIVIRVTLQRVRGGAKNPDRAASDIRKRLVVMSESLEKINNPIPEQKDHENNNRPEVKGEKKNNTSLLRATQLVLEGHLKRAASSLMNKPLQHPSDLPSVNKLTSSLHKIFVPPKSNVSIAQALTEEKYNPPPPLLRLDNDIFDRAVVRLCNGAAPALSGWTGQLLRIIAEDEVCRPGLVELTRKIICNLLPRDSRSLLSLCKLFTINKTDNRIRPITIREIFVKLAQTYKNIADERLINKCFPTIQLGVGAPGGSEALILRTQFFLEHLKKNKLNKHPVVLKVDFTNAFNNALRPEMARALVTNGLSSRVPMFCFTSEHSSGMVLQNSQEELSRLIRSEEGTFQGDTNGSFDFSLMMQPGYEAAVAGINDTDTSATIDDFVTTTLLEHSLTIATRLSKFSREKKIDIKCATLLLPLLNPDQATLDAYQQMRQHIESQLNIKVTLEVGWMEVTGGLVGELPQNDAKLSTWFDDYLKQHDLLFDSIPKLSPQIGYQILKSCMIPRMNFLTRVVPPSILSRYSVLTRFDKKVRDCFSSLHRLSSSDAQEPSLTGLAPYIINLPTKQGGLAIRCLSNVSPVAYLSATVQMFALAIKVYGTANRAIQADLPLLRESAEIYAGVSRTLHQRARAAEPDSALKKDIESLYPLDFASHIETFAACPKNQHLQKFLTSHYVDYNAHLAAASEASHNPVDAALLRNIAAPSAGTVFDTLPSPSHRLSADAWNHFVCLRLGKPPCADALTFAPQCPFCFQSLTPSHFQGCVAQMKLGIYSRHQQLVNAITRICSLYHLNYAVEVPVPLKANVQAPQVPLANFGDYIQNAARTDVEIYTPNSVVRIDVTTTHPLSPSNLNTPASSLLENRVKAKLSHYKAFTDAQVHIVAMDTFGIRHKSIDRLLKALRSAIPEDKQPDFAKNFRRALSFALAQGVWLTHMRAMTHARHKLANE